MEGWAPGEAAAKEALELKRDFWARALGVRSFGWRLTEGAGEPVLGEGIEGQAGAAAAWAISALKGRRRSNPWRRRGRNGPRSRTAKGGKSVRNKDVGQWVNGVAWLSPWNRNEESCRYWPGSECTCGTGYE